jgi:hypothetical protein
VLDFAAATLREAWRNGPIQAHNRPNTPERGEKRSDNREGNKHEQGAHEHDSQDA